MLNAISRFRLMLPIMTGLVMLLAIIPGRAAEPLAAGLWQKVEDGKPVVWVLVVDHDGIFEGVIAKTFPLPGEDPNEICAKCTDDGKIYKAKMSVSPDGQSLTMRGYWGISLLGKDETWSRLPDTAMTSLDPTIVAKYLPALAATPAAAANKPPVAAVKPPVVAKKSNAPVAPVAAPAR